MTLRSVQTVDDGHVRLFVPASFLHSSNAGVFAARAIAQRATSAVTCGPALGTDSCAWKVSG